MSCVIAVLNKESFVFEVILVFEQCMLRAQHFFPASQIGNRSFVAFQNNQSLAEDWLHTAPALRSTTPLSFLRRTALTSVQSTKYYNATCGNSESLHDLVTISQRDSGMTVCQLRLRPSILCSTPSVFRAVHCRWVSRGRRFTLFPTNVIRFLQTSHRCWYGGTDSDLLQESLDF